MRRIRSKDYEEKKRKKNNRLVGIILVIVMFGSVFGVIVGTLGTSDPGTKMYYNGFEFNYQNGLWVLDIENINFIFKNNPNQVEEINGSLNNINSYQNKPLYIYSENKEVTSEVSSNIGSLVQRMQFACFEGKECEGDLPLKTCDDNFIIIEEKNETSLIQEGNCVFIQGPSQDLVKISDEFLFKILGIRQQ